MTQNYEMGDDTVVSILLTKFKSMLNKNSDMMRLMKSLKHQLEAICAHEMCSSSAQQQLKLSLSDLHSRQVVLIQ